MTLSEINFGDVDAKNEILKQSRSGSSDFFESFTRPANVNVAEILEGRIYFIFGLKGTGKTALLRYVKKKIDDEGNISSLTLFKSQVSEEERQDLSKSSGYEIISTENGTAFHQDFKEPWKAFIFQRLARTILEAGVDCDEAKELFSLTDLDFEANINSIGAFFSRISRGSIEISGGAFKVAASLGLDVENDGNKKKARLTDINRTCSLLLQTITFGQKKLYALFDELELYHETDDQFDRDRRILRDLISSISQLNAEFSENSVPVFLCSTLRTEVLHSVLELGHEIGKDIDDYGIRIDWSGPRESPDHPLMKLMGRKISISTGFDEENIWKKFFPEKINNKDYYKFILQSSYYRPRDLVRLLRIARDHDRSSSTFTTKHFDATALEYSKQTWLEITEELLATYSKYEMKSLEKLFLGFRTHFMIIDLQERVEKRHRHDRLIQDLVRKHGLNKILSDLYRIGVVGNDFVVHGRVRNRWIFRGNTSLNDAERMAFHKSLWKHLSLVEARNEWLRRSA